MGHGCQHWFFPPRHGGKRWRLIFDVEGYQQPIRTSPKTPKSLSRLLPGELFGAALSDGLLREGI